MTMEFWMVVIPAYLVAGFASVVVGVLRRSPWAIFQRIIGDMSPWHRRFTEAWVIGAVVVGWPVWLAIYLGHLMEGTG